MVTDPMIYLHQILIARKSAPNSVNEFKNMLKSIWFKLYKREVRDDSSSFEHVFVGEVKNGEVSGKHFVCFLSFFFLFFFNLRSHILN